jgi:hypothetical protein
MMPPRGPGFIPPGMSGGPGDTRLPPPLIPPPFSVPPPGFGYGGPPAPPPNSGIIIYNFFFYFLIYDEGIYQCVCGVRYTASELIISLIPSLHFVYSGCFSVVSICIKHQSSVLKLVA